MNLIESITTATDFYNLHSHTQFCDGHASMEEMAKAAVELGMEHYGFSPHSPIIIDSPCNMTRKSVDSYLGEVTRLQEKFGDKIRLYPAMEIDFLSPDFGPHLDYFQKLPLDYSLGSVHFVPNQDGFPIDCDGSSERFLKNLRDGFAGDLRYVVEKYFEQVLTMIEIGGFNVLAHPDKIAQNAVKATPDIESESWYAALMDDLVRMAVDSDLTIEINTKYLHEKKRFFPATRWWDLLLTYKAKIVVDSDAHRPEKINEGRPEAFQMLREKKILN